MLNENSITKVLPIFELSLGAVSHDHAVVYRQILIFVAQQIFIQRIPGTALLLTFMLY